MAADVEVMHNGTASIIHSTTVEAATVMPVIMGVRAIISERSYDSIPVIAPDIETSFNVATLATVEHIGLMRSSTRT